VAKRGRQSAASLEIVRVLPEQFNITRLPCPPYLSGESRAVWLEVTNDQPSDAFSAVHAPLLEMYCSHVVQARVLAQELARFDLGLLSDDDGLRRYDKLLTLQERESRAASALATRLRITRQAVDQQTIARGLVNQKKTRKPWERNDD